MIYSLIRPLIFTLDAERAHTMAIKALKLMPSSPTAPSGPLSSTIAGLEFPNPVGMAAGFDKDAQIADKLLGMGFGFAEVGSITPRPQAGNPKPRLFRLAEDQAVINRMGFNNSGAQSAQQRLAARAGKPGILGINIGANKDSDDRIADYVEMTRIMAPFASYIAVNVSSPNTPGLRALQDKGALAELLAAIMEERGENGPPVFLKVAPDLEPADIDAISRCAIESKLGALIISNTTIARPPLKSANAGEAGGLSGAPLRQAAQQILRDFRKATGAGIPLIGVGGIATASHAYERIKAGASLIQLYSAMIYKGPGIARDINSGIEQLMRQDGFSSIEEAVGSA